jgi:hypothetical protein
MATTWTIFIAGRDVPKTVEDCSALEEWVLGTLVERVLTNITKNNFKVGDILKLADKGFTRVDWLIGRVVKTYPGEDGKVQVVTVQTRGGQLKRPITKMARIEIWYW